MWGTKMETISRTEFIKTMQFNNWDLIGTFPNQKLIKHDCEISLYGFSFKTIMFGNLKELTYTVLNASVLNNICFLAETFIKYERKAS